MESNSSSPKEIIEKAEEYQIDTFFSFGNLSIVDKKVYLSFQSICIAYSVRIYNNESLEDPYALIPLENRYKIESKFSFHGEHPFPFMARGYYFECRQFKSCLTFTVSIKRFSLKLLPYPYKTNCENYSELNFPFENFEPINSRSRCVQECLKQTFRTSLFYYSKNDKHILSNEQFRLTNEMNEEYLKCEKNCHALDCRSMNYFVHGFNHGNQIEPTIVRHHKQAMIYKAIPYISIHTFYLLFLGLICLIFNTSILTFLCKLERISLYKLTLKNSSPFNSTIIGRIKKIVFIIAFLIGTYYELIYYEFYRIKETNYANIFYAQKPIYPTDLTATSCFNISYCLPDSTDLREDLENHTLSYFETQEACDFRTLTSVPLVVFENYHREIRVLNEKSIYRSINNSFLKCFQMKIDIKEPRYRSVLFGFIALLNLTNVEVIYLTDHNNRIDSRSRNLKPGFIIKHVTRKLRSFEHCLNYIKEFGGRNGCVSRENCQDKCYIDEFVKKYRTIPYTNVPVYAEYFNNKNLLFNISEKLDQTLWNYCKRLYEIRDCDKVYIDSHDKQIAKELVENGTSLRLNLVLEHNTVTTILITNTFELVFHGLTLGSVLFSLSIPNLLHFLAKLTKFRFFNFLIQIRAISSICFLGFCVHSSFVLKDALTTDLIADFSNTFNFLEPNQYLPLMIFCVRHNIDINSKLAIRGQKLIERTLHINESYLFHSITYYDLEYKERKWFPSKGNQPNLQLDYFFINQYKCYEINYHLNSKNIYGSYIHNVMKVRMADQIDDYLFSYRAEESISLADYYTFQRNRSYFCNFEYMHETIENRFKKIINPLLILKNNSLRRYDVKEYVKELKQSFLNEFNYTTTLLPLTINDSEYEIRNDLFKDFINYYIEPTENELPEDNDYKLSYYNVLLNYLDGTESFVYMKKVFFAGDLKMSNKDDSLSVMLNLLNALSIWLNLALINLTHMIFEFAVYVTNWLKFKFLMCIYSYKIKNSNAVCPSNAEYLNRKMFKKSTKKTNLILIDKKKNCIYYLE